MYGLMYILVSSKFVVLRSSSYVRTQWCCTRLAMIVFSRLPAYHMHLLVYRVMSAGVVAAAALFPARYRAIGRHIRPGVWPPRQSHQHPTCPRRHVHHRAHLQLCAGELLTLSKLFCNVSSSSRSAVCIPIT